MKTTDPVRETDRSLADTADPAAHTIWVPTFLLSHEKGLGDVFKQILKSLGAKPCPRCDERAARLNRWLRFAPARQSERDLG